MPSIPPIPSTGEILSGLTRIANEAMFLAVIWHAAVALALLALLLGWRPQRRLASLLLTLPLYSVAALALAFGNLFNTVALALLATLLLTVGWRFRDEEVERRHGLATVAGGALIAFGLVYPHFLEGHSALVYLVAAPTGLLPCPSLSLVVGFALMGGGLSSRAWSTLLAAGGLFYGAFGALRLGVWLDLVLLAASVALLVLAFARAGAPRQGHATS